MLADVTTATWVLAMATVVLAGGAIVTAVFAIRAFGKQSDELGVLQQQASDQAEELAIQRRQAETTSEMLRVQSGQLASQQQQFDAQKDINEKQTTVLGLQAEELSESLAERKRQAEQQRRAQASQVAAWFGQGDVPLPIAVAMRAGAPAVTAAWGAWIRNESALPALSVRVFFNYIHAETAVSEDWQAVMRGGPVSMIRVLPPRTERFVEIPDEVRTKIPECDESVYAVSMEFMDAAGIRWVRDARGALKER
jgi:hypothetical protein